MTEDDMAGWHHKLNGHEFEQNLGDVKDRETWRAAVHWVSESWTIKKAECRRITTFELWCWRRPLRIPWTARRSNQSILKEISTEYSLEGLMLKLKLQYLAT